MDVEQMGAEGLRYRRKYRGVIGVESKVPVRDASVLSLVYTPGVAEPCLEIARDPDRSFDLTMRGNTVALITDGTGLDAPPEAALPLMEAKAVLFKTFAGIDAFPIALNTRDLDEAVQVINALTPTFGAICLDTIAAPHSFSLADHLEKAATVPVFSNGHHATGILVYAALLNALKVVGKTLDSVRIVVSGAGASGIGVARLLTRMGAHDLVICDREGAIYADRQTGLNWAKAYVAKETNPTNRKGSLADVIAGADVFIGLSAGGVVSPEMVRSMAPGAIVFALALPVPEIDPIAAREAGAQVVATGRSDYANQLDVALVFPGFFRGLLDCRARNIRLRTLRAAAEALAALVPAHELHADHIIPAIFDFRVAPAIAAAVTRASTEADEVRRYILPEDVAERTRRYCYEGRLTEPSINREGMTFREEAIDLRERYGGLLAVRAKIPIRDQHLLNLLYVPPAALAPVEAIRANPMSVFDLTARGNLVGIVTDGSAVLGLGDIGPRAALPVMEGKAVLFQTLAGIEAFPICLAAREVDEIVDIVTAIAPSFGGINLEDIAAPRCFAIEEKLKARLDIPVFHDDQHGTAVVTLAALVNALRLVEKEIGDVRIIINGAGAAGVAVSDLLLQAGAHDVILCDTKGALVSGRGEGMNEFKEAIAARTNPAGLRGSLAAVMRGADVFIGLSAPGVVTSEMVREMAPRAVIFAMANPVPEILPDAAHAAGAAIVATGRSDFPNQVNNSIAFPGIFRGALDARARTINDAMKVAAAEAIARLVTEADLKPNYILPTSLDLRVPAKVAAAVARVAAETGVARVVVDPVRVERNTRDLIYEGLFEASYVGAAT